MLSRIVVLSLSLCCSPKASAKVLLFFILPNFYKTFFRKNHIFRFLLQIFEVFYGFWAHFSRLYPVFLFLRAVIFLIISTQKNVLFLHFLVKNIKKHLDIGKKVKTNPKIFAHPLPLFRENTQKQTTIAVKKSKQALFFSLDCYYLCTKTRISQEFSPYYIYDRPQYHWTNYGRRQNRRGGFRFCSSAPTRGKPNRIMPVS